jgi:hypothetical protein
MIVYESLSGMVSASTLHWNGNHWLHGYESDVTPWAKTLLGSVLGPTPMVQD